MATIRMSPKHGVNPTVTVCAFCGNETGIGLCGRLDRNDTEAPLRSIVSYEPCDKCKEQWAQGVALIEALEKPVVENQPPIKVQDGTDVYPTGRVLVVKETAFICGLNNLKKGDKCFIDREVYDMFASSAEEEHTDE